MKKLIIPLPGVIIIAMLVAGIAGTLLLGNLIKKDVVVAESGVCIPLSLSAEGGNYILTVKYKGKKKKVDVDNNSSIVVDFLNKKITRLKYYEDELGDGWVRRLPKK